MENVSKALIMASGVIIGVIILTMIVFGYRNIREVSKEEQLAKQVQQVAVFNKEYESYNKKLMRGVELISLMNKAIDNNTKYENSSYYNIQIEFEIKKEASLDDFLLRVGTYDIQYYTNNIKDNKNGFEDFKRKVFDCTKIEYNEFSGRVKYMKFVERIIT